MVVCGWTLGSAGIQKLVTLKARVLLDAGEGVIEDALKQIDLETWSFQLKFFIFFITNFYLYVNSTRYSERLSSCRCLSFS